LQNALVEKAAWWAAMWHASKEIASALIAGVIVDWKRLLRRPTSAASAKPIAL